ncbi:MAG: hypothetical protein HC884_19370 [Chloroflexaceae bacterium]|nr:hypothetical protein [Chloroflexaceae bacterium]
MSMVYAWNLVNPTLCYGRDGLLQELLRELPGHPGFSFGIAGGRRMGKTTLLRRVEMEIQAHAETWRSGGLRIIPLYLDGLALPRPLTAADVWGYLLRILQDALPEYQQPAPLSLDFDRFKDVLRDVLRSVLTSTAEQPRLIVLFDEIEPVLVCEDWAGGLLANWRALLSNTPGLSEYLTTVFAGAREMALLQRDITSPLADILKWRNLRVLEFEDACRLMQEPLGQEWSDAFLETVYRETGGHPMLLQYIMQYVCSRAPGAVEPLAEEAIATFAREQRRQFSQWWSRYCSPDARLVYARLPDDGSLIPRRNLTREFGSTSADNALEILQHVGLVTAAEDGFAFRYSGEMFRRWYREYGKDDLNDVPRHDPDIYTRLCNIQPHLGDRYLTAWKIYQNPEFANYSGAAAEMRDIITGLLDVIAPKDAVEKEAGFKREKGRKEPSRIQQVAYAVRHIYGPGTKETTEVPSDYSLLEAEWEKLEHLEECLPQW